MSYANKLKSSFIHPKKEQGIYMNAVDEINIREYLYELSKYINPQDIISASRISNKRICIYLSKKELVEKLIQQHKTIQIANNNIEIRKVLNPTIKLIISNIDITIPNSIIEDKFKEIGLKLSSGISFLRVGMKEDIFSHILSHRRQCYVLQEDNLQIPEHIFITYEEIDYKIYLTEDNIRCDNCKRVGHTVQNCHQHPKETSQKQQELQQTTPNTQQAQPTTDHLEDEVQINSQKLTQPESSTYTMPEKPQERSQSLEDIQRYIELTNENIPIPFKRTAPQFNSSNENLDLEKKKIQKPSFSRTYEEEEEKLEKEKELNKQTTNKTSHNQIPRSDLRDDDMDTHENTENNTQKNERQTRKPRSLSPRYRLPAEQLGTLVKQKIKENPKQYILSYEELVDFYENAQGASDPLTISRDYTNHTRSLIHMIDELKQNCSKTIKSKLTRITSKLKQQIEHEENSN